MPYRLTLLLVFLALKTAAQLPVLDAAQNPAALRWQQVRTPHFQVIFPQKTDSVGLGVARQLEQLYGPVSAGLQVRPRRIPIVLQTRTSVSNGFVTPLPRYSEFFITPPQSADLLGNMSWLRLLSIHEYRHVVQMEKARQGTGRLLFTLFGYSGLALSQIGVPDWWAEGDAVLTETLLSQSGRGRLPGFNLLFRTQLASRPFSYFKAVAGSYRDAVPDWYVLGYHLNAFAVQAHGGAVWSRTLDRYYGFPFYPFSFSAGLKKTAGTGVESLYKQALAFYRKQFSVAGPHTPARALPTAPVRVYTDYEFPQALPGRQAVALKSGLGHIPTFVLLDEKTEKPLFQPGTLNGMAGLSATGRWLVWAELHPHLRWGQQNASVIKVLHIGDRHPVVLWQDGRYFAPALSPDARRLAAIETDGQGRSFVVVGDVNFPENQSRTQPGLPVISSEKYRFPNADGAFFQTLRFSPDGSRLLSVKQLPDGRKTLTVFSLPEKTQADLFKPLLWNLQQPAFAPEGVVFTAPVGAADQLVYFSEKDTVFAQVTRRPFGAYHASFSAENQELIFQDFSPKGHRIASMPFEPRTFTPLTPPAAPPLPAALAPGPDTATYALQPYRKSQLFNVYGLSVLPDPDANALTLALTSRNLLNTLAAWAGVTLLGNEGTARYQAQFSYGGWWPFIDAGVSTEGRNTSLYIDRSNPLDSLRSDRWRQNTLNVGLRLPLQLTRSRYWRAVQVGLSWQLIQTQGYALPRRYISEPGNHTLVALTGQLQASNLLRQAPRDVLPRWGQVLLLQGRQSVSEPLRASQWVAQGRLHLPGVGRHHAWFLRAGWQRQGLTDRYVFSSPLAFPRGHAYGSMPTWYVGTLQYALPVAYPDWTLGPLAYVQRIRLALWADAALGRRPGRADRRLQSYGADLNFDFNLLRLRTPLDAGLRAMYVPGMGWQFTPLVVNVGF